MFKDWDFERGVLAFMGLLIVAGLGFIVWQTTSAEALQGRIGSAESQLKQIGELANQVIALQLELADDDVASNRFGPYAYIEQ